MSVAKPEMPSPAWNVRVSASLSISPKRAWLAWARNADPNSVYTRHLSNYAQFNTPIIEILFTQISTIHKYNLDSIWFPKCQVHTVTSYPVHNSIIFVHLGQNSNTTAPKPTTPKTPHVHHKFQTIVSSQLSHYIQSILNLEFNSSNL